MKRTIHLNIACIHLISNLTLIKSIFSADPYVQVTIISKLCLKFKLLFLILNGHLKVLQFKNFQESMPPRHL